MRKWIRRSVLILTTLIVAAAVLVLWLWRDTPGWYQPQTYDSAAREAAARRVESELERTLSWANRVQADEAQRAQAPSPSSKLPHKVSNKSLTVRFTEQELNAFFQKWSSFYGWSNAYGAYVTDPAIVLRPGRLILAGKLQDLGAVASFHFQPHLEDGGSLRLDLVRAMAGRLPMPAGVWSRYRSALAGSLDEKLPRWRESARIDPNGAANQAAIAACMTEFLFNVLKDEPGRAVLFLPVTRGGAVPVRIVAVDISDDALMLQVEPMSAPQRAELIAQIQHEPGG